MLVAANLGTTDDDIALAELAVEVNLAAVGRALATDAPASPSFAAFRSSHVESWAIRAATRAAEALFAERVLPRPVLDAVVADATPLFIAAYLSDSPDRVFDDLVLGGRVAAARAALEHSPTGRPVRAEERRARQLGTDACSALLDRTVSRIRAYVTDGTYPGPTVEAAGDDRLDASTLSLVAHSLDDERAIAVNEELWDSGLVAQHRAAVEAAVGTAPDVPLVAFARESWLSVGNAHPPVGLSSWAGAAALTRPYAVMMRATDCGVALRLWQDRRLDPLVVHEFVHTTQKPRWGHKFDPDPGWLYACEQDLTEGVTEALARRIAGSPGPLERDPDAYCSQLVLAEVLARLVYVPDPASVLVAASKADASLEGFARVLLPSRLARGGVGEASLTLAEFIDGIAEDIYADVERLVASSSSPPLLSALGDIDALVDKHVANVRPAFATLAS